MKFFIPCLAAIFATGVLAAPTPDASLNVSLDKRADRGQYTVSGLGSRKKAIIEAGGNSLDLAIAMLEIEDMNTAHYPYGDGKTYDAANFGLFKQNWGLLRECAHRYGFKGKTEAQWHDGAVMNSNVYADVASRWDCQNYYGYDKWFAGHRNGASGLANPYTADINTYKSAVQWIQKQIDSNEKYKYDDTRFWVSVVAI
ncbi:hypothetical protein BDV27DRAFT_157849 [Aspergillus caelatus]|uniref:Uncharacterized protein n=2 Tax=Aspergillus subgen. Circumdati TaxID=2720871 RepID=A0A5N7A4G6_9EURO|nr:uncharacterized protein BDV27DRAFT_157849 [Aspergillus caelatus]KAE8364473.1 hypothetical protein BDV27DRAFT_157849 [Aspergillus caelatus]KAE8416168.1 hypothetical protein BDV36DRAFT_213288 [Aspergillus pseudocaelatus]